jgi:hypothetical protein
MKEPVQQPASRVAFPGLDHHAGFNTPDRGYPADRVSLDLPVESCTLRFVEHDGDDGRAVDHHQRHVPISSYPRISSADRVSWSGRAAHSRAVYPALPRVAEPAYRRPIHTAHLGFGKTVSVDRYEAENHLIGPVRMIRIQTRRSEHYGNWRARRRVSVRASGGTGARLGGECLAASLLSESLSMNHCQTAALDPGRAYPARSGDPERGSSPKGEIPRRITERQIFTSPCHKRQTCLVCA